MILLMQSLVLRRRDIREFDQIVSIYTREKGRLDLLARGVKKITSKNAAHLEPFCLASIDVAPGKEVDHLTKVMPIKEFFRIRADLKKSMAAGFAMSFIYTVTDIGEPDARIWELTVSWLEHLERSLGTAAGTTLLDAYVLVVLACLGMAPILDRCVICGEAYRTIVKKELRGARAGMYPGGGGFVCPDCAEKKKKAGEDIAACGLKEVSNLQLLMTGHWPSISEIFFDSEEAASLHRLVYQYTVYHVDRRIGDWALLLSMPRPRGSENS